MNAAVAVTVMHVLLFVLYVCVLQECAGARVTEMQVWGPGGVVAVSAYMGGTRGSGVLSSACDVLEMSVVRGVGGVCDMCICLARGGVGGVGVRGFGLGFTNPGGTVESGICVCVLVFGCGGVGGVGGSWARVWGGWGGVKSVFLVSLDSLY